MAHWPTEIELVPGLLLSRLLRPIGGVGCYDAAAMLASFVATESKSRVDLRSCPADPESTGAEARYVSASGLDRPAQLGRHGDAMPVDGGGPTTVRDAGVEHRIGPPRSSVVTPRAVTRERAYAG